MNAVITPKKEHYKELDSIRGVASLSVLITHLLLVFPVVASSVTYQEHPFLFIAKYVPFLRSLFIGGPEAVKLFFVLSGFVLALPFLRPGASIAYLPFMVKRFCRIYFPYYTAISLAFILSMAAAQGPLPEYSGWFNSSWADPLTLPLLLHHLFLLGEFNHHAYNNVIWSLIHEMRVSLIFPLLMYGVIRFSWKANILLYVILGFAGFYLGGFGNTLGFLLLFVVGALLAKHKDRLIAVYQGLTPLRKTAVFFFGFCLYSLHLPDSLKNSVLITVFTDLNMIGCCILILAAMAKGAFSRLLRHPVLHFFGKISYSLYLLHLIVLIASVRWLHGALPVWLILGIAAIGSIALAALSYYAVEVPSIKIGQKWAARISGTGKPAAPAGTAGKVNGTPAP
ncbi:acyltransferase family protein [Paenibacillus mucilaginosus]|uniref:Acyltransferase family protein n=1 Tax=Paenibacillus mucilaginosus (strain KNP414) TaxID=1036673 RepID=F8FJE1_PAEMK|nr:acyltransferase [Paenibacillus mucilaginosus]AEI39904.1 acyltransferase family protein [Paenibacillus mucilaginosus KNP414]MCG7217223.1 acyltransferase [Paenibacillus mucilaginosus]WDM29178.1 acyltransferase [Paenibacillus mucilaginosus]